MEKLAENLQRLTEDDLLQVVQMIHDNKSPETYTKNDVERRLPASCTNPKLKATAEGEFHVDLYTLPDTLVRQLWDFSQEKL